MHAWESRAAGTGALSGATRTERTEELRVSGMSDASERLGREGRWPLGGRVVL